MVSFLFIDSERDWRGGQTQLYTLMQGLQERGHSIHLVCPPQTPLETRARNLGISVHPAAIRSELGLVFMLRLFFIIRSVRPGILAFNTPKPILMGTLASRFVHTGARIIFRRVDFPLKSGFLSRMKYVWGIDCIISISNSIKFRLQSGGIPETLIRTIYEGIDLSLYPASPGPGNRAPDEPAVIGTVSHLSHEKGMIYLIEAAALIPDVQRRMRFVVVGDGACRSELQELVRKKGLEPCFQFLGFRSDSHLLMKSFDIFVLPSVSEGLSSSIIEAMASSLPVIGSRVGGIPELVLHGKTGLLVNPADPQELAHAIQHLALNPETSRQMGQRGRKRVEEEFGMERKIEETERLCLSLVNGSTAPSGHTYA